MALVVVPTGVKNAVDALTATAIMKGFGETPNVVDAMMAGGYKFMDYVKVGGPLLLLFFIATLVLVPWIWSF